MSRLGRVLAVVALLAAGAAAPAPPPPAEALVRQAIEAYDAGQSLADPAARTAAFERAGRLFDEAAARGLASADVYANAGTAALRAERLGDAILAFRRALALDPDNARARRNLDHARGLLPAWVPRPESSGVLDTFFFWHRSLSARERRAAAAVCFLLAALAGAVSIRWPGPLARGLAVIPLIAWLGLVASLAIDARSGRGSEAVVVADETVARASDSPNAPARFAEPLPGGTEVEVAETRERWARVRLASGLEAWVARAAIAPVTPPS